MVVVNSVIGDRYGSCGQCDEGDWLGGCGQKVNVTDLVVVVNLVDLLGVANVVNVVKVTGF